MSSAVVCDVMAVSTVFCEHYLPLTVESAGCGVSRTAVCTVGFGTLYNVLLCVCECVCVCACVRVCMCAYVRACVFV